MKRIALKTYGKLLTALFAVIGFFTRCDIVRDEPAEYGTPSADYIVKGKVLDARTKGPISDIRVIRKSAYSPHENDTVNTNSKGEYEIAFNDFPAREVTVYAEDMDGEQNGVYATDTLKIKASEFEKVKKGDGSWYSGTFEKKDADFILNPLPVAEYGIRPTTYKKISKKDEKTIP